MYDGNVDLLCAAVGTGGAFMGTLNGLNKSHIYPKAVALEPLQSPFLTTGKGGSHKVEGIGVGFYPPFLDAKRINECILRVINECKLFIWELFQKLKS